MSLRLSFTGKVLVALGIYDLLFDGGGRVGGVLAGLALYYLFGALVAGGLAAAEWGSFPLALVAAVFSWVYVAGRGAVWMFGL